MPWLILEDSYGLDRSIVELFDSPLDSPASQDMERLVVPDTSSRSEVKAELVGKKPSLFSKKLRILIQMKCQIGHLQC